MIEQVPLLLRQNFEAFIVVDEVLVVLVDDQLMRTFLLLLSRLQAALLPVSEPLSLLLQFFLLRLLLPLVYATPLLVLPFFLWLIFFLGLFRLGFLFGYLGSFSLFGRLLNLCQLVLEGLGKASQGDTCQRVLLNRCSFRGSQKSTKRYAHFSLQQSHGLLRHSRQVSIQLVPGWWIVICSHIFRLSSETRVLVKLARPDALRFDKASSLIGCHVLSIWPWDLSKGVLLTNTDTALF